MAFHIHRRQFLAAGLASATLGAGPVASLASSARFFHRSFAGLWPACCFAGALLRHAEFMPPALEREIEAELERGHRADAGVVALPAVSFEDERRCAEFFAWLAVRAVAPPILRRAGYDALAEACEQEMRLDGGAASTAQHAVGRDNRASVVMPRLVSFAYGASAHAANAACFARQNDVEAFREAGAQCGYALLSPLGYEDATAEEIATIWRFAVAAINEATMRQARSTQMGNADSAMQNIKVTVGHTSDDTSAAPPHG